MEELKELLKKYLEIRVEDKCAGHMAPTEKFVSIYFDNEKITESLIMTESFDGDSWSWN